MSVGGGAQYCGACLAGFDADTPACPECAAPAAGLGYRQAQQPAPDMLTRETGTLERVHLMRQLALRADAGVAVVLLRTALATPANGAEALAVVEAVERLHAGAERAGALRRMADEHPDGTVKLARVRALTRR